MTDKVALLLEDEALIAMDLEQTLATEGFRVISLSRCSDGVEWLQGNTPSLAILDVELSDGDCDEAASLLAERHVPVIVYSGGAPEAARRPALAAARWLPKPSGANMLLELIRELDGSAPV